MEDLEDQVLKIQLLDEQILTLEAAEDLLIGQDILVDPVDLAEAETQADTHNHQLLDQDKLVQMALVEAEQTLH